MTEQAKAEKAEDKNIVEQVKKIFYCEPPLSRRDIFAMVAMHGLCNKELTKTETDWCTKHKMKTSTYRAKMAVSYAEQLDLALEVQAKEEGAAS